MKATLKNLATDHTYDLAPVSIIGRSSGSQIEVPDAQVSRRHAMIRFQDRRFFVFDLGSFNGSYVNGSRITTARALQDGDVLTFANHQFGFHAEDLHQLDGETENFSAATRALIRSSEAIILVSDVMGFTALSEDLPADDLAQLMGRWYGDCETILAEEGATIDRFIGDSVLAYWTGVDEARLKAAAQAARRLLATCERAHEERPELFENTGRNFRVGVALHTGKVAYGGLSQGEFTLMGDPVNLAFRMEALTRSLGHDCLFSGEFVEALPASKEWCESLGLHAVKGRSKKVEVFGVTRFPE